MLTNWAEKLLSRCMPVTMACSVGESSRCPLWLKSPTKSIATPAEGLQSGGHRVLQKPSNRLLTMLACRCRDREIRPTASISTPVYMLLGRVVRTYCWHSPQLSDRVVLVISADSVPTSQRSSLRPDPTTRCSPQQHRGTHDFLIIFQHTPALHLIRSSSSSISMHCVFPLCCSL